MLADLPALRPDELARALTLASEHPTSFVADTPSFGTTLYCTMPDADFVPTFGGPSRAAHLAGGAVELVATDIPTVRRDVDTESDLREAAALGVGPLTRDILTALETVRG
jgi:2-phospho-L-lactate guanylyltransferase